MSTQNMSRRRFLKFSTAAGFGALLAACGTTAPTGAPAAGAAVGAEVPQAASSAPKPAALLNLRNLRRDMFWVDICFLHV